MCLFFYVNINQVSNFLPRGVIIELPNNTLRSYVYFFRRALTCEFPTVEKTDRLVKASNRTSFLTQQYIAKFDDKNVESFRKRNQCLCASS